MIDLDFLPLSIRPRALQLSENIDFEKSIEKGGNGFVLIGNNRLLGRKIAVKFYYWGGGDHAEPQLLAKFEHDHILSVLHAEKINEDDAFFITPFCEKGDLDDALSDKRFGPLEAIDLILQIASGASYMHGRQFLHRDLKPSNIFCLTNGKFVIGDFGSVVQCDSNGCAKTLTRHSLLYRPPEEISLKIA